MTRSKLASSLFAAGLLAFSMSAPATADGRVMATVEYQIDHGFGYVETVQREVDLAIAEKEGWTVLSTRTVSERELKREAEAAAEQEKGSRGMSGPLSGWKLWVAIPLILVIGVRVAPMAMRLISRIRAQRAEGL